MENYNYYQISQKSRYALRALLELAIRQSSQPVGVKKVSEAQNIPTRFLEVILSELRQGGFVHSVRGKTGGYLLARSPDRITAGQIIRFVESGKHDRVPGGRADAQHSVITGDYAESWLFNEVDRAVSGILDTVTLDDMVQQEMKKQDGYGANYVI